jgi:hypothetical protein
LAVAAAPAVAARRALFFRKSLRCIWILHFEVEEP